MGSFSVTKVNVAVGLRVVMSTLDLRVVMSTLVLRVVMPTLGLRVVTTFGFADVTFLGLLIWDLGMLFCCLLSVCLALCLLGFFVVDVFVLTLDLGALIIRNALESKCESVCLFALFSGVARKGVTLATDRLSPLSLCENRITLRGIVFCLAVEHC